ncbi:VOC family protein [Pelomonas sp. SE-A7]|uniref:VOC family protein n=1 Tax=Pelomonas sp. SE-A7 TaxID=3054953 RepID=UPI00259CE463|nr:VOC family protein [Pelomonas sp. SE-A7]MDM4765633.1 VOC family protein [Pelomonas sp. SE-A7]
MDERVTGIGGIFIKARDAEALRAWYRTHLGMDIQSWGGACFMWQQEGRSEPDGGMTLFTIFEGSSSYFEPSKSPFMINLRVADLPRLLEQLRAEGCQVDDKMDYSEYGKFGWVMDPEGNRIELWQPPAAA